MREECFMYSTWLLYIRPLHRVVNFVYPSQTHSAFPSEAIDQHILYTLPVSLNLPSLSPISTSHYGSHTCCFGLCCYAGHIHRSSSHHRLHWLSTWQAWPPRLAVPLHLRFAPTHLEWHPDLRLDQGASKHGWLHHLHHWTLTSTLRRSRRAS